MHFHRPNPYGDSDSGVRKVSVAEWSGDKRPLFRDLSNVRSQRNSTCYITGRVSGISLDLWREITVRYRKISVRKAQSRHGHKKCDSLPQRRYWENWTLDLYL